MATLELVTNIRGMQGVPGPTGLPGVNAVANDSATAGYVGTRGSATNVALETLTGVLVFGAGIDPTGVADSTVAIQAIIDANPGRRLHLPAGVYKISAITLSKGQHLQGAGQQDWRDRFTTFGSAGWLVNANFSGTVIRSTLTTANPAVTILDTEVNSGGISDLTLIGPGTGTSNGLLIGSTAITVVNLNLRNVKVGNFYVGVRTRYCNEGVFDSLAIRGCATGLNLAYFSNQNTFRMLDVECCAAGIVISADSTSNAFYSMICQSNTGLALSDAGIRNSFYTPYFENNTGGAISVASTAKGSSYYDPFLNGASDTVTIAASAAGTKITGFGNYGTSIPVVNAGTNTFLEGRFANLTDTGVRTILLDPSATGSAFGLVGTWTPTVTGITPGNGTVVGAYRVLGKKVFGEITFTVGSTTVMTGIARFSLIPGMTPVYGTGGRPAEALIFDNGTNWFRGMGLVTSAGEIQGAYPHATTGALTAFTATTPITWATGDVLSITFEFERV